MPYNYEDDYELDEPLYYSEEDYVPESPDDIEWVQGDVYEIQSGEPQPYDFDYQVESRPEDIHADSDEIARYSAKPYIKRMNRVNKKKE